jgi:hypothetical protein
MNQLTQLISELNLISLAIVGLIGLLGVLLLYLGLRQLWQRRIFSGGFNGLLGICLLLVAAAVLLVALNILTYHRLTYEEPILTIHFKKLGEKQYSADLKFRDNGETAVYDLSGDEWQIDARVLSWKPPARVLGLNAMYRLERLHGRYQSIDHERQRDRTVYSLVENKGLDIWPLVKKYNDRIAWVDAYFGSATYLPMEDDATYEVLISQNGLIARPLNSPARARLSEWQ